VSEYQYYEFLAVDRPLDAQQLRQVRTLSTRARITPTSFVNTYNWGNFRGDPRRLMERYYDAFLYVTNWGTRQIMLRLPATVLDLATAQRYCRADAATAWASNGNVILDLTRDSEDGEWDEDEDDYEDEESWDEYDEEDEGGEGRLGNIISARADLAVGDLRLLYLAWLLSAGAEQLDADEVEPPVPAGLGTLSAPLRSLVDFLHIDRDLLSAAAATSPPSIDIAPAPEQLAAWVHGLAEQEKDELILRVLSGEDAHLRTELLRRFRGGQQPRESQPAGRTVAQLLDAAARQREDRERRAAEERARQQAERERVAVAARTRRLNALAADGDLAWQRVTDLVDTKKTSQYDVAVTLLHDLYDLAARDGDPASFAKRVREIRARYANRPALLERLNRAGLPGR
jgi:hypothetical protein